VIDYLISKKISQILDACSNPGGCTEARLACFEVQPARCVETVKNRLVFRKNRNEIFRKDIAYPCEPLVVETAASNGAVNEYPDDICPVLPHLILDRSFRVFDSPVRIECGR